MIAKDILEEVLSFTGCTANSLANAIGLTRSQALYDIQNGKTKSITQQMADKIVQKFPEIRRSWLITGEGSMLVEREQELSCSSMLDRLKEYKGIEKDSDFAEFLGISRQNLSAWRTRDTLNISKIIDKIPKIRRSWLLTGEGDMLLKEYSGQCIDEIGENNTIDDFGCAQFFEALRESQQQITQLIQSLQTAQEQLTVMTQRLADSQTQVDNLIRVLVTKTQDG